MVSEVVPVLWPGIGRRSLVFWLHGAYRQRRAGLLVLCQALRSGGVRMGLNRQWGSSLLKGGRSYLGWRWSGRESMTAVADIVCRPHIGRHWAGTRPAPTVAARGRIAVGVSKVPILHDGRANEGGRCGGNPPAQGRAEGPTAQNCSGR